MTRTALAVCALALTAGCSTDKPKALPGVTTTAMVTVTAPAVTVTAKAPVPEPAGTVTETATATATVRVRVTVTEKPPPPADSIDDGTWTVGEDVKAGSYKVAEPISGDCYWAITRSGTNGDDIIANGLPSGGRPSVTIRKGQDFETNGCGTWVKTG